MDKDMEDLTKKLKVGDTVYMKLQVSGTSNSGDYPIYAKTSGGESTLSFTKEGKHLKNSTCSDLILSAPAEYPKVMEVSLDGEKWQKRTVLYNDGDTVVAFSRSEDGVDGRGIVCWTYVREIQPELERIKLTIQEIADKLGVDAGLIDIIKG